MYRALTLVFLLVVTAIMGFAFSAYAIHRFGEPQNVVDASHQAQAYHAKQRVNRADPQASDTEPAR